MTLTTLPGSLSRWEGLQAMLKADSGRIDDMPKLQTEKLVAFVIEPIGKGGSLTACCCAYSWICDGLQTQMSC